MTRLEEIEHNNELDLLTIQAHLAEFESLVADRGDLADGGPVQAGVELRHARRIFAEWERKWRNFLETAKSTLGLKKLISSTFISAGAEDEDIQLGAFGVDPNGAAAKGLVEELVKEREAQQAVAKLDEQKRLEVERHDRNRAAVLGVVELEEAAVSGGGCALGGGLGSWWGFASSMRAAPYLTFGG